MSTFDAAQAAKQIESLRADLLFGDDDNMKLEGPAAQYFLLSLAALEQGRCYMNLVNVLMMESSIEARRGKIAFTPEPEPIRSHRDHACQRPNYDRVRDGDCIQCLLDQGPRR